MWKPISEIELDNLVGAELEKCSVEQRNLFSKYRVSLCKTLIHRLGNLESVFVVAKLPNGLLYYEDVEGGFEVGSLGADGAIQNQGCNQYELRQVLAQLKL